MSAPETAAPAPDERARLAVLVASGPLVLSAAPVLLPFEHGQSLSSLAGRGEGILLLAAYFTWPALVGAAGLAGALRRRPPGRVAFGVPAVAFTLAAVGLLLVLVSEHVRHPWRHTDPAEFAIGAAALTVLGLTGWALRGAGWARWSRLVAAAWLSHAAFAAIWLATAGGTLAASAPLGMFVSLFAAAAAAPAVVLGLTGKRG